MKTIIYPHYGSTDRSTLYELAKLLVSFGYTVRRVKLTRPGKSKVPILGLEIDDERGDICDESCDCEN